jgi:S-adenosylmethionine synthetase
VDLVDLYLQGRRRGEWLANDTSIGVGFAPASELERIVAAVEARLNSGETKAACPEAGEDIKVMGIRRKDRILLTVSCAFIGGFLSDSLDYLEKRERVLALALETAQGLTGRQVSVSVNAADDPAQGRLYLTVTGTSAEAGDDGEAGRGNRANGLITPYRPMTLEAAAGKNPVTHVGKLYQIASLRIAESLVAEVPGVVAAECTLVSLIGRPVGDPQTADIRVRLRDGRPPADVAAEVEAIARGHLARLDTVWRDVLEGRVSVY